MAGKKTNNDYLGVTPGMSDKKQEKLQEILSNFDADFTHSYEARREAVADLFFSRVSQWDDWLSNYVTLQYRGQFDIVRPVVRKLVAEMRQNPIQVRYRPKDGASPDAADTLQGMYRADVRSNSAIGAINVAVREQLEGGYGAWRWITEYESENPLSNTQRARRVPIHEAADHVIWDSSSKQMDKSDARHVTIITAYTPEAWLEFAEKEGIDCEYPTFRTPDAGFEFPWMTNSAVHVGEYYERVEKRERVFIYQSPSSDEPVAYWQKDIKKVIDQLADMGYEKISERLVTRIYVYKYLTTGTKILKGPTRIAGTHLPVVPAYGEWGFAGGKEIYEGVVRLMKDAQRARNTIMSFNMDIVSKSPRKKPFFYPEQIAGFEDMYDSEDDYPYYLINRKDDTGADLPGGAVSYLEGAEIPQGNQYMLEAASQAIREVSALGVGSQQVGNGQQVAFDTVNQLNQRADMESFIFMDNLQTAMRRDGEIYASIINEIYDVPRTVLVMAEDGTESEVSILEQVLDPVAGEVRTLNDVRGNYETYVDVGPSYQSQKEANRAELKELIIGVGPATEIGQLLLLQYLTLQDGKVTESVRKYANRQLVLMGFKEPETEDEKQALRAQQEAQQQQGQQQDPNMVLAQAEYLKAQAQVAKSQNEVTKTQIDGFTAQSNAQRSQAETVKALAQAQNISDKSVTDAINLLAKVRAQANEEGRQAMEALTAQAQQWQSQQQQQAPQAPQAMPQPAQQQMTMPQGV